MCTVCFKYHMCCTPVLHLLILTFTLHLLHSPITPVSLITCTFPSQLMHYMYSSTELYPQSCLLEPRFFLVQLPIFCKWRICYFNNVFKQYNVCTFWKSLKTRTATFLIGNAYPIPTFLSHFPTRQLKTGWPTVKRGIPEFCCGILDAFFCFRERFSCNNNVF